jgi:hypothetical protein
MVIFNPIGGQEKNNTKYLLERNMALEADTPRQVSICIKDLFINRNLYLHIKESIIKNKVFNPSLKIADLIIQTTACRNIK